MGQTIISYITNLLEFMKRIQLLMIGTERQNRTDPINNYSVFLCAVSSLTLNRTCRSLWQSCLQPRPEQLRSTPKLRCVYCRMALWWTALCDHLNHENVVKDIDTYVINIASVCHHHSVILTEVIHTTVALTTITCHKIRFLDRKASSMEENDGVEASGRRHERWK
jgi:hypothetical protein